MWLFHHARGIRQPQTQNSRYQQPFPCPLPFSSCPAWLCSPVLNLRAHQSLDQLVFLLSPSMLDARIGQQSQPVQPWPQARVTVCQPEQTNQCFSRSRSKALCPKPSPSSLSFPGNGLSNRLGKRSQDLSKLSEVWHLCWADFHPVNHLPLCLISSECRPPLQNCPPSRTREGQVVSGDCDGERAGPVTLHSLHQSPLRKDQVTLTVPPWLLLASLTPE